MSVHVAIDIGGCRAQPAKRAGSLLDDSTDRRQIWQPVGFHQRRLFKGESAINLQSSIASSVSFITHDASLQGRVGAAHGADVAIDTGRCRPQPAESRLRPAEARRWRVSAMAGGAVSGGGLSTHAPAEAL